LAAQTKLKYFQEENNLLTYTFGELTDKLTIIHLKIWHIEDKIEEIKEDKDKIEEINKMLDQVVTLNKLRVEIVKSIDELYEGLKCDQNVSS
jgi:hypothetical protein